MRVSNKAQENLTKALLDRYGRTYAEQAGIRLANRPAPLFQLLVLCTLLSARITGDIAVAAARELFAAGYRTPEAMSAASWQDRVDALGRGHYRRYDERTATMLGKGAEMLTRQWGGDLRKLRDQARGDTSAAASLLTGFPGIGRVGADIFLREVQGVWPEFAPHLDAKVLAGARELSLPDNTAELAGLAQSPGQLPHLAAALVRVSTSRKGPDDLTG